MFDRVAIGIYSELRNATGYLISQYPAGYLLQRFPLGKVIGVTTLIWGVLIITTPACHNFAGIATNRFLLGVFEAVVNPGFVLVMAMWFRADEQPMRLVICKYRD